MKPLEGLEERLLARVRDQPVILADLSEEFGLPVPALEAVLHALRRRGLVRAAPLGTPQVWHWTVA